MWAVASNHLIEQLARIVLACISFCKTRSDLIISCKKAMNLGWAAHQGRFWMRATLLAALINAHLHQIVAPAGDCLRIRNCIPSIKYSFNSICSRWRTGARISFRYRHEKNVEETWPCFKLNTQDLALPMKEKSGGPQLHGFGQDWIPSEMLPVGAERVVAEIILPKVKRMNDSGFSLVWAVGDTPIEGIVEFFAGW